MTLTLFLILLTIGAAVSSLLTEALKKAYDNAGKTCLPNILALINAIIVGAGGTALAYIFLGISWNANNIICLALMSLCVWVAEMVGYDKVIQTIQQIEKLL